MTLSSKKLPSHMRVQDRFLQYVRKNWRGMRIKSVQVPVKDRLLEIKGSKGRDEIIIWLFWKGRDLYFADMIVESQKISLFQSWVGKSKHDSSLKKELDARRVFAELELRELEEGVGRQGVLEIDSYLRRHGSEKKESNPNTKESKKLKKKLLRMKEDLKKFEVLKFLEKKTNEDLESVKKIGEGRFSVSFRGLEGHYKKREYLYNKIKKWKKSKDSLEKRIDILTSLSEGPEKKKKELKEESKINQKIISPIWGNKKESKITVGQIRFVSFIYKDFKCFVGRRATESDAIRKEIAKKDDLWIHLDGHKSGHLFIKSEKDPNVEELTVLASALVDYSGLKLADIPILFTQVKNLKGVKGVPGMVNYKKEKQLLVIYDSQWRQKVTSIEDNSED